MDFSDPNHTLSALIFQGAEEQEPAALCDEEIMAALARWQSRDQPVLPDAEHFQLEQTRCFTISYDGKAGHYWPNEDANLLGESLVRDFLFHDGICTLDVLQPRLFVAKYKVEAILDTEYLLVCPYPTDDGNIAGVVVVCVNRHLKAPD